MSKKKFTDGLESLFSLSVEESQNEETLLIVEEKEPLPKSSKKKKRKPLKKRSGKSFTSDLDALFSGVSAAQEETPKEEKSTKPKKSKAGNTKVIDGLDSLLRSTIDPKPYFRDGEATNTKRVTFTFDKNKFAKLKKIAKTQKAYLKDILGKVVTEYINEYEQEHGQVEK